MSALVLLAAAALNCANPVTQVDMTMCAAEDFRQADAVMNRQWVLTMKEMKDYDKSIDRSTDKRPLYSAQLLAAQRAWIAFRDAHCATEGMKMRGGSGEPMLVGSCKASLTEARTKQLKDLVVE